MSLEKWSIEEGWILCKIDGLQCSINCPQFKRGTTLRSCERDGMKLENCPAYVREWMDRVED
jgi:hypothetical protein